MSQECVCEDRVESRATTAADQQVVETAFPHVRGLDRRVAFLFEHGQSRFFRVNFHDPEKQNFVVRSHFVEVRDGKSKEWPGRLYAKRANWDDSF